jgi:hypothetical protein
VDNSVKSEKKKQQERMVLWNMNFWSSSLYLFPLFISWNSKAYRSHHTSLEVYFQWINKVHGFICIILFLSMLLSCSILYTLLARKFVVWSSSKSGLKIMFFLQCLIVKSALSNVGWNRKG